MAKTQTKSVSIVLSSSLVFSAMLFYLLQPYMVSALEDETLATFVQNGGQIEAFEKHVGEFTQIAISWNGQEELLTDDRFAHAQPQVFGHQVVWSAQKGSQWQVFLYDAIADSTTQLTFSGNNVKPLITQDLIVWEGQVDNLWQIFVYQNGKVNQISDSTNLAQDLQVHQKKVVFAQKNPEYGWQVKLYDSETREIRVLTPETSGYKPEFVEDKNIVRWQIPLADYQVAYGQIDLSNNQKIVADTVEELHLLTSDFVAEASVSAAIEEKLGKTKNLPLPETLQILGIIDERGRVIERF